MGVPGGPTSLQPWKAGVLAPGLMGRARVGTACPEPALASPSQNGLAWLLAWDPWETLELERQQGHGAASRPSGRSSGRGPVPALQAPTHLAPSPSEREGGTPTARGLGAFVLEHFHRPPASATTPRAGVLAGVSVPGWPLHTLPLLSQRGSLAGHFFPNQGSPISQPPPSGCPGEPSSEGALSSLDVSTWPAWDSSGHPLRSLSVEAAGRLGNMNNV